MHDHDGEEYRIEPWKWRCKACDEPPVNSKVDIARVMDFARLAICQQSAKGQIDFIIGKFLTPAIAEQLFTVTCLDRPRVLNLSLFEIGKCGSFVYYTALLLSELILLTVASVPDIVNAKTRDKQGKYEPPWPLVLARFVVSYVENSMSVREWHASHCPEKDHETCLLVVYIPETSQKRKTTRTFLQ